MKKNLYLIAFCLFVIASAKAQYVTIYDQNIRNNLKSKFPTCFNASEQMDTTCNAIIYADSLDLSNGLNPVYLIRYFKHLKYLNLNSITGNIISGQVNYAYGTILDGISFPQTLKYLDISNNQIQTWNEIYNSVSNQYNYVRSSLFSKFPDSLETLIADNILFIENCYYGYSGGPQYSTLKDSFPTLPSTLKRLKFSSGSYDFYGPQNVSTVRFKTNQLPSNLNTLEINTTNSNSFNQIVPYTSFPSTLNNFSCNCDSADMRRIFSIATLLPAIDTLYIGSYGLITKLPNSLKYASLFNVTFNKNVVFQLDSLKSLNIRKNNGSFNIVASVLTKLNCDASYLNYIYLQSDSLTKFFPTNNLYLDTLKIVSSSLKYLNCSNQAIKYLSPNSSILDTLICDTNKLNNIAILPNSIRYLACQSNKLTALPNVPTSLNYFNCSNNLFATLPALPNGIQYLDCSNMGINPATNTKLNTITNLPNSLQYINCINNSLVYLPPMSTAATKILCSNNLLHALPALPNTLKYLDCSNNYFLTTMPTLSNVLDTMKCNINNLTRLPGLPASLKYLDCSKNAMTYLPELPDGLSFLHCWNNDFYCLPKLPSALSEFWVSTLHIACMPNTVNCDVIEVHDTYGTGYYNAVLNPAPPLCNPASNANQCKFKPVMEGTIYYDINSNGIKDANEYYSKNVKVQLSNGAYTFTDNSGHYELTADSLGDYTIKIIAPQYYAAMPDTFHYTFTQYNASVSELVALQPKQNIDSLNIKITPWQNCARPASNLDYIINYENVGTTNLSPIVTFNYDSSLLTYVKSSNYFVTNSGNKLTLNISSFAVGQTGGFTASFTVKSTDTLGSIINANTAIVGGSSTAIDSIGSTVKSSFDPNDKQATPVLTPLQIAADKYIDYTIRFQNTGTDTAFNIVLTDTLSNQLLHNTLQLVGSSHNCKATVKDNVAVFEFLNINLADSNTNSLKSHGFVNFRVKPLGSLVDGDVVPNIAAVYFDYNTPVNTNTAYTFINLTGIITPVKLINYDAKLINEKVVENVWQTENEVGCSHYNIQKSPDGVGFETIGKVLAGKNNYSFNDILTNYSLQNTLFYRLQIIDKNGSYTYSPIKRIQLNGKQRSVIIYPNPAKEFISIEAKSIKQIKIIDNLGRVVLSRVFDADVMNASINISALHKGFYAVQVMDKAGEIRTEKLIVE